MSEERKLKMILSTGDRDLINAFYEELYSKYKGLVCFVVSKYIKSFDDIIDIAQEVFLGFFNNADKVNSNIKFYLTSSAKNKAINYLKKYNNITLLEVSDLYLLSNEQDSDYYFYDTLKVLKENLKSIEYDILYLHLLESYTFKEIASKMSVKESSIKSIYFRALKKSRRLLERRWIIWTKMKIKF